MLSGVREPASCKRSAYQCPHESFDEKSPQKFGTLRAFLYLCRRKHGNLVAEAATM